jgi:hypothetical protein
MDGSVQVVLQKPCYHLPPLLLWVDVSCLQAYCLCLRLSSGRDLIYFSGDVHNILQFDT